MTTVYKYRIKCTTENLIKHWLLLSTETPPSTCPTNAAHSVDLDSVAVVDTISERSVYVKQASTETGNNFMATSKIIAGATGPNVETFTTISWPHPIVALTTRAFIEEIHRGDKIDNAVAPNTVIGYLTTNEATGATGLHVSQTVIDNTMIGYYLSLLDTNNMSTFDCGRVIGKNDTTNVVYIENALNATYTTLTYIKQTIYVIKDYIASAPGVHEIGSKRIYGSYLPANTPVRVSYTNNGNVAKTLIVYIEYMY